LSTIRDTHSAEAEELHKQGRQAGGTGDYKKALALFERDFPPEDFQLSGDPFRPEPLNWLTRVLALHLQDDGAVFQRGREFPDLCDCFRPPCGKDTRLVLIAYRPNYFRRVPPMAAVEYPAQFVIAHQE